MTSASERGLDVATAAAALDVETGIRSSDLFASASVRTVACSRSADSEATAKKIAGLSSVQGTISAQDRTLIVLELRQQFPLVGLLQVAGLHRSTFYYQRRLLAGEDRHEELRTRIKAIFAQHRVLYGYRRVTAALREGGETVNHKTVQRLMQQMELRSKVRVKRFQRFTGRGSYVAPDLLQRDFQASRPNEKWVTDVTEFSVANRKLYLSPVMDLYNGEIVGFHTAESPVLATVETMLGRAVRRLSSDDRPILHSDQGWQYRMPRDQSELKKRLITQSMSRKGNCLDNAAMESFFGTLKAEFFHLNRFDSIDDLAMGIRDYIRYYNEDRIKTKLGTSPDSYRMRQAAV